MTTGKQDDTKGADAMPVGIASTDQLGPLVPAAWLCEWETWRQTHIPEEDPLPETWDDEPPEKVRTLYELTDAEVELVTASRRTEAWKRRDLTQCRCDRYEYCRHCLPLDFRRGGKWNGA